MAVDGATIAATAFRFGEQGGLWVASPEAVRRVDLATGEVRRVPFDLGLTRAKSIAVSPDEQAVLVVDEGRCLLLFDPLGDAEEPVELFVEGIADEKREKLIGGREIGYVYLRRFLPGLVAFGARRSNR